MQNHWTSLEVISKTQKLLSLYFVTWLHVPYIQVFIVKLFIV